MLSSFGVTGSSACDSLNPSGCDSLSLSFPLEAKIIHNATKIRSAPTTEPTAIPTFAPVPSPLFDDELGIADEVAPANQSSSLIRSILDKPIFELDGDVVG